MSCSVSCCPAGLGEFRIRDLNDEINKLLREKRHWEERILQLGGTDYMVRREREGEREREKRREIERGREGTERGGDGAIMEGDRGEGSEKIDGRESGRERGKGRMG